MDVFHNLSVRVAQGLQNMGAYRKKSGRCKRNWFHSLDLERHKKSVQNNVFCTVAHEGAGIVKVMY